MARDDFMIHGDLPVIDLDRLTEPVARVRLFGEVHDVKPVDGRAADLLQQVANIQQSAEAGDANAQQVGLLYYDVARQIVATIVPTLPTEQRLRLTIEQMTTLIGLATKQVREVEAAIEQAEGNGRGPVTGEGTPASPVPTSPTPSPPSSSASPATRGATSLKSRTSRTH